MIYKKIAVASVSLAQHICARILLVSLAHVLRFVLTKHENFQIKSVSQSTRNALKCKETQEKFFPLTQYA